MEAVELFEGRAETTGWVGAEGEHHLAEERESTPAAVVGETVEGSCPGEGLEPVSPRVRIRGFGVFLLRVWRAWFVWKQETVGHGWDRVSSKVRVQEDHYWCRGRNTGQGKRALLQFQRECPLLAEQGMAKETVWKSEEAAEAGWNEPSAGAEEVEHC